MALNFNKVNFNVRKTSVNVTVPNSPVARLMYYLNSTCSLLQLDTSDSPNLQRLTLDVLDPDHRTETRADSSLLDSIPGEVTEQMHIH